MIRMVVVLLPPRRALLARATPRVRHQKHLTRPAHKIRNNNKPGTLDCWRRVQVIRHTTVGVGVAVVFSKRHRMPFVSRSIWIVVRTLYNIRAAATATVEVWCTNRSCPHQGTEIPTSGEPGRDPTTGGARHAKKTRKRTGSTTENRQHGKVHRRKSAEPPK